MPSPNNNLIKYNQGKKSLELPFIIYADLKCLLKKIDTCQNNPELSSTTKINQHIPSGYSIYTTCSYDKSNNKLSYYRVEDCMKRFCKDLKDHATGINKKVIGLMKDELGGDIITEFVALRPKAYSYITNNFIEMKKAKGNKKCVVNKMLRFDDYYKSENHEVYTENINKIALSCDDDKRIVTSDRITSYPYGYILKN